MKKLILIFALQLSSVVHAQSTVSDYFHSNDSDAVTIQRVGVGYLWEYNGPQKNTGVISHYINYSGPGWNVEGAQVGTTFKRLNPSGWLIGEINATTLNTNYSNITGLISKGWFLSEHANIEVFVERDYVDTQQGTEQGIITTNVGAAGDYDYNNILTTVYVSNQHFTDDNNRFHARIGLGYIFTNDGNRYLDFQAKYRYYEDSNAYTGNYFNPNSFQEILFGPTFRVGVNGWTLGGFAGYGPQRIDGDSKNAYAVNFKLTPPKTVDAAFLSLIGGFRNDGARGDGYKYGYVNLVLTIPIDRLNRVLK